MMHGFQQIVTQAERRDNFVVHGLLPLGDAMAVAPLMWRKKLMDSISGNLGYYIKPSFLQTTDCAMRSCATLYAICGARRSAVCRARSTSSGRQVEMTQSVMTPQKGRKPG